MKIECTPKEIADFVTELQSRLSKFETTVKLSDEDLSYLKEHLTSTLSRKPTLYIAKDNEEYFTLNRNKAKLDLCGNPFIAHF